MVDGSAFGTRLSAANRLAPPETCAQVISTYFVFAYSGLAIPVRSVGVAADYFGDYRAVLGCSIALAAHGAGNAPRIRMVYTAVRAGAIS